MSGNPWRYDERELMHDKYRARARACRDITPRVLAVFSAHVWTLGLPMDAVWDIVALGPDHAKFQVFLEQCIRDYEKKTGEKVQ